jgi:hypothetical protein
MPVIYGEGLFSIKYAAPKPNIQVGIDEIINVCIKYIGMLWFSFRVIVKFIAIPCSYAQINWRAFLKVLSNWV